MCSLSVGVTNVWCSVMRYVCARGSPQKLMLLSPHQDNGLVDAGLWSGEEVRPVRDAVTSRLSSVASLRYCLRVRFAG
jgi:hypothetical protein